MPTAENQAHKLLETLRDNGIAGDPKAITPPRKQPYVKVRSAYHDGEKMICRDALVRLDRISLIEGPSRDYPEITVASAIVEGNSIQIHPDEVYTYF